MPGRPKRLDADFNPVCYADVRSRLRSGDIALSRADHRLRRRIIAYGTDSEYCHAAMLGWCNGVVMIGEAVGKQPTRLITLSSQVKRWPGYYDIYRVRRPFKAAAAWEAVVRATGSPYGYEMVRAAFWQRFLRWPLRMLGLAVTGPDDSDEPEYPRDCSGLVSYACRQGGRDPSPNSDALTAPAHLAAQGFSTYFCTLYPTPEEAAEAASGAAAERERIAAGRIADAEAEAADADETTDEFGELNLIVTDTDAIADTADTTTNTNTTNA